MLAERSALEREAHEGWLASSSRAASASASAYKKDASATAPAGGPGPAALQSALTIASDSVDGMKDKLRQLLDGIASDSDSVDGISSKPKVKALPVPLSDAPGGELLPGGAAGLAAARRRAGEEAFGLDEKLLQHLDPETRRLTLLERQLVQRRLSHHTDPVLMTGASNSGAFHGPAEDHEFFRGVR